MTEYWVSQGNKWCDFCKIYIANNPASIRTHEFGQRHKDNVSKKLTDIRKANVTKEKEKQQALKDMERIEAQAIRSYQKDLAAKERTDVSSPTLTASVQIPDKLKSGNSSDGDWMMDQASGYLYSAATGFYHDPKSGLYYSEKLGKWAAREEVFSGIEGAHGVGASNTGQTKVRIATMKGKPSSLQVGKRKTRERPETVSKDEIQALKAREAAKKRVQEREKGLMGLYQS